MTHLEYAARSGRRDSSWSLVGFALAAAAAAFSGWAWWTVWRNLRHGAASTSFGVTPLYYLGLAAVATICLVGLRRGRRRYSVAGLVLLMAATAAMLALVGGSPWSAPPATTPAASRAAR